MLIIGNPENRRVTLFQQALESLGQSPASVISWLEILVNPAALDLLAQQDCIRIESPGENFTVEKKLLQLGGLESATNLPEENGRIYFPGIWYKGFHNIVKKIAAAASNALWLNHPDDILAMFDKPQTKLKVSQINPDYCAAICPDFTHYDEFMDYVRKQKHSRFFVKLNTSSSASGVLAFEYNTTTNKAQAQTTIELVRKANECYFFNSLKLKKYSSTEDLTDIINFLFDQGAYVEPWISKARHEDGVFDLRVLAINGKSSLNKRQHTIARISKTPITNLHLGNQRGDIDDLHLSSEQWQKIDELTNQVMTIFPNSLYSGLDILIPQSETANPILLEANAFGDLLPGLLHSGYNTYQAEITALFQQYPHLMRNAA